MQFGARAGPGSPTGSDDAHLAAALHITVLDIEGKDVGRAMRHACKALSACVQGACMHGCKEYSASLPTRLLLALLFLTASFSLHGQEAQVVQLYRNGCVMDATQESAHTHTDKHTSTICKAHQLLCACVHVCICVYGCAFYRDGSASLPYHAMPCHCCSDKVVPCIRMLPTTRWTIAE